MGKVEEVENLVEEEGRVAFELADKLYTVLTEFPDGISQGAFIAGLGNFLHTASDAQADSLKLPPSVVFADTVARLEKYLAIVKAEEGKKGSDDEG